MRKGLSAIILCGLGAGALALSTGEPSEAAAADPVAVDRYLARLSEAEQRRQVPLGDEKIAKVAEKLDRAEPMISSVLDTVR